MRANYIFLDLSPLGCLLSHAVVKQKPFCSWLNLTILLDNNTAQTFSVF